MAKRYIKGRMVEVADRNTQAVLRKLHSPQGQTEVVCDVCHLPVENFTKHNRDAYVLHLAISGQLDLLVPQVEWCRWCPNNDPLVRCHPGGQVAHHLAP